MTKFTAALITLLVAGVVPFGKAVCQDGEIGMSQTQWGGGEVSSTRFSVITFENDSSK